MDTTEKIHAEKDLRWNEERLRQLIENVKDFSIFITDLDGRIENWNLGAELIFGYSPEEIIGQSVAVLFTPEDRANGIPKAEMQTAAEKGCADDERWHLRKDGSRFFASGVQTPLFDETGRHTGYAKIARDLTERIEFQDELREAKDNLEVNVIERTRDLNESNESLRSEVTRRAESEKLKVALMRKIIKTQEDERKRIAREIHDHIGQQMTGLQLTLQILLDEYKKDSKLSKQITELKSIVKQIDSEVNFLAWELRSSVLDDLGLSPAMKKFVEDWSVHFNVAAEFHQIGLDGKKLLPEIEINLYRIGQEALNNICKHARANNVSVLLERLDGTVSLIIEDDGIGFEPGKKAVLTGNDRGMGLLGMKERAELVGGKIEIESSPGSGTTIYARVPAHFDEEGTQTLTFDKQNFYPRI